MKRILITGFEPFSDFKTNPSEMLVRGLSVWFQKNSDHQIEMQILPVEYGKVERWFLDSDFSKYDFVFLFGVAAARTLVSLERVALNWMESKIADNSGVLKQGHVIDSEQPTAFFSELNLSQIALEMSQQFDNNIEVSFSAGAYLCNFTYFKTRIKTKNSLFVHIPSQLKVDGQIRFHTEKQYSELIHKMGIAIVKKVIERK